MCSKLVTVILPACNEEDNIQRASQTVAAVLEHEHINYELLFVNDGSKDDTWEKIEAESVQNSRVRGLSFSRNFGKEAAVFAGLSEARGDCCVVMDTDLQHPPEKIIEMYRLWQQGAEVVEGVKLSRGKEAFAHSFAAKCFYGILSRAVKVDMSRASDFKLLDRKAVDVLLTMREKHAFFRALSSWIGFKTAEVEFEVNERAAGKTKWSTWSLVKYAVQNVVSFSSFPLQIVTFLGFLTFIASIVLGATAMCQRNARSAPVGFVSVIAVLLFIGSIIMVGLGCIGYYLAKIYDEIKDRPRYIISKKCGK